MTKGKATGRDRDYQVQCRDLLMRRYPDLKPYAKDGIDIAFDAGGTVWTVDVALIEPSGGLLIVECKRHARAIEQGALASFAKTLDLLRASQPRPVAGVFFAKRTYQQGALKFGNHLGLDLACLVDDGVPSPLRFHRWDSTKGRRVEDVVVFVSSIPSAAGLGTPTIILGPPPEDSTC